MVGRILPISPPIAEALARRRARRDPDSPLVFHRDGIPVLSKNPIDAVRRADSTLDARRVATFVTAESLCVLRERSPPIT